MKKSFLFVLLLSVLATLNLSAQVRELQLWRGGNLVQSFAVSQIDSLKFGFTLPAPTALSAKLSGSAVSLTWQSVSGATSYQVWRSSDGQAFTLLASGVTKTAYTDASPLKGSNYYRVRACGEDLESPFSATSAPVVTGSDAGDELETGLYMGIIGFSDGITDKGDMAILAPNTKSNFISFVNALEAKAATFLYYGVDKGLDKLIGTPYPNNLTNVAIVTFTDGLDQGSAKMVNYAHGSTNDYRDYLSERIKSARVQGLPVTAHAIGLRGGDVTNPERFLSNLRALSSHDTLAVEAKDMAEVKQRFQQIASSLIRVTERSTLSLTFNAMDEGTLYRFTFDAVSNAADSKVYIEANMNPRTNTFYNVHYVGLTCASGSTVQGKAEGYVKVVFDFEDVKMADGSQLSLDNVNEYFWDDGYWQVNSEFSRGKDVQVNVSRSSAAIMLVLDCSTSLLQGGDKFTEMKTHVKSFIETLAQAMDNASTTTPGGGTLTGQKEAVSVGDVAFNMIKVQGGTFLMGSTTGESDEQPVHAVTLSDYYIGETEVTQELWQAVMGTNPSYRKGSKLPVEYVSWNDCRSFIEKLNTLTGKTFRLPTEAEWEFAARGGKYSKGYVYSGSNEIDDVAWYNGNSSNRTHEVATKKPNELGLYDMSGNVWEWCSDWYGSYDSAAQTNPTGPTSGSTRVLRGGSWGNAATYCRTAIRNYLTPTSSFSNLGFRLALPVSR